MKEALRPYAPFAKVLLTAIAGFLVTLGWLTAATAQLVIGAAMSFGVAFWKLYDAYTTNTMSEAQNEWIKMALAALSTILLAFGYADNSTIMLIIGGAGSVLAMLWTLVSATRATSVR